MCNKVNLQTKIESIVLLPTVRSIVNCINFVLKINSNYEIVASHPNFMCCNNNNCSTITALQFTNRNGPKESYGIGKTKQNVKHKWMKKKNPISNKSSITSIGFASLMQITPTFELRTFVRSLSLKTKWKMCHSTISKTRLAAESANYLWSLIGDVSSVSYSIEQKRVSMEQNNKTK